MHAFVSADERGEKKGVKRKKVLGQKGRALAGNPVAKANNS